MTAPVEPGDEMVATATARRRVRYRWSALALIAVSIGAVAVAAQTDPSRTVAHVDVENLPALFPAPEIHAKGWLNSEPLTSADLSGKVVVYDFWTYSCVNCVRTIPYLRSWYDRYQRDGLVVVGIHSPEFDFEKSEENVAKATEKLRVTWPVALDPEMHIWETFNNLYWPAKYIADRQGQVRFFHPGEGAYSETEEILRTLLGVDSASPKAAAPGKGGPDKPELLDALTPETYLFNLASGSRSTEYPEPRDLRRHNAALVGRWEGRGIDPVSRGPGKVTSAAPGAAVRLSYVAREVNLVMATAAPGKAPIDVVVELDGKPVSPDFRTKQTMVDSDGRTFVRVVDSDLYRLVLGPQLGAHELRLTAPAAGLVAYAFTFGA